MKNTNRILLLFVLVLTISLPMNAETVESDPALLECTNLLEPLHGTSMVPITTDLTWAPVWDAVGYYLKVGTFPGGGDILDNIDVGNVTTFDPGNFPCSSTIFVTITPYDGFNTPPLCDEEVFETEYVDADAGPDQEICSGNNVLMCANGGIYYSWEPAELFEDPNVQCPWVPELLETTVFWVTVTNENGCWDTDFTTIYANPNPVPNVNVTHNTCYQCNNGTATMNPVLGEPPYSYQWSTGETTQSIQNLAPGDYWGMVQDANFCTGLEYFTIYEYNCPELVIEPEMVNTCVGSCNGYIEITGLINGTPPYTYSWNTGQTSSGIYSLCEGNYVVTVTDALNCSAVTSLYIYGIYDVQANLDVNNETCLGCNDGSAAVFPSGGYGAYWYSWSTGESTQTIENLPPGSYSVTVGDQIECFDVEYFNIEPYICPELELESFVEPSCFDMCTGNITINNVINGTPPYTYVWSHGESGYEVYNLCPGNYGVTITDSKNCIVVGSYDITEYPAIQPNATGLDESCNDCNNGYAYVEPTGGTPPYWYQWSTGETTQYIYDLAPGTYNVLVGDVNECTVETGVTINEYICPDLIPAYSVKDACYNECNGYINIYEMLTGEAPFSYLWESGETTASLFDICEGWYYVTITDANNCSQEFSFQLIEGTQIYANLTSLDESCLGCNDGEAFVNPEGGLGDYWYLWNTGETTQYISGLEPGDYWVNVGDADGCYVQEYFTIYPYDCPSLNVQIDFSDACYGDCNGFLSIFSVNNGVPPFTYSWDNGETTAGIYDLCPGDYTVIVTDSKNCSVEQTYTIYEYSQIVPNAMATDETCMGCNDGSASANPSGGSPPYWYQWSTGETTQTITGLAPGTYSVVVGDVNECTSETTVVVNSFDCPGLQIENDIRNACYGSCDGYISIYNILNGVEPFSYAWSNGENTQGIYNLCPGTYTVTATDANNCTVFGSYTIDEFSEIMPNVSSTGETCTNCADGSATVNPTGGTPPYWYQWSTGETIQTITGLAPGTYSVLVGDVNECTSETTVVVNSFDCPGLQIEDNTRDACFNGCDGYISIFNIIGASPPVSYVWSNGETSDGNYNLCPGTYSVTATDANGCEVVKTYTINEFSQIIPNASSTDETCENCNDGTATVNPAGGTPPYWYQWSTGASTQSISSLAPGSYTVTVGDVHECTTEQSVDVVKFGCPDMTIEDAVSQISCYGRCDGSIAITDVTNTINTLLYSWSNGSNTSMIQNLCAGTYHVTVTDVTNGCSVSESYQIIEPEDIQIIVNTTVDPSDTGPGSIEITTNNDGTYTFTWEGPDGFVAYTEDIYDLSEGCYHLIVANGNDCSKDITICLTYTTGVRSVNDLEKYLSVYPNPTHRFITVEADKRLGKFMSLTLVDMSGIKQWVDVEDQYEVIIDVGLLEDGLYFLTAVFSEGTVTKKIIINK